MVTTAIPAETRTILSNISWQTFKIMLAEMGSERKNRLAYDNGILEIMTPLMPHENSNRVIEGFVVALCEEFGLEFKRAGSLTLIRDNLERASEPDSSYYIQNESRVRNRENIDLAIDPPPDLVLEVEYSKPKVDKSKIYTAIGVPEFWRYNGSALRIYILNDGQYTEVETSPTFASVPVKEIPRFIQETKKNGEMATTRAFRAWVKQQIAIIHP
ncbi:Uma2 family endonuclease [Brasilonema octagenarum UFV-E1]|uniref:Uma2 family endonuclease n=2 Tax=Brasilonema TaxID=383614 RepID=A0A856MBA9_9CYAN|nr:MULTISPECIES: Uma2 family endonuclease [Brasilonema]NMF63449.1 Uma2 family endonuclease [Brasilonema octagenarum UFV-OR1]QDL07349.1 Uma2 family endonuclease [Brasilonema sennae CENA114]QDL13711.1 Uma2 family endonuclease [Brasilonema octagenarum UFV-E1]